ncbi:MAG: DUF6883 domain-containing protein [Bacteroidota bacterium]
MKLPSADRAVVSKTKLTDYLLSEKHPVGRSKAIILKRFGYTSEQWQRLAEDVIHIAKNNEVTTTEESPFGLRYVIDGVLPTPSGKDLPIRTVWFIDNDEQIAHFVTAYPR